MDLDEITGAEVAASIRIHRCASAFCSTSAPTP
jgi:hypothetical protein